MSSNKHQPLERRPTFKRNESVEINKDFICPISLQLMSDPVVDMNGHTFERKSIDDWYQRSNISPITHLPVSSKHLTPNLLLKRQIMEFKEQLGDQPLPKQLGESSIQIEKYNYQPPKISFSTQVTSDGTLVQINTNDVGETGAHRHIILLVDESGSMDQKVSVRDSDNEEIDYGLTLLDIVRHSVQTLLNILLEDKQHVYYLTIISFTSTAERECIFLKVDDSNKARFNRIIEGFRAKHTTNIWDAFRLAFLTIEEHRESPIPLEHQVILFTDGVPNTHPFASQSGQYTPEQYFQCIQDTLTRKSIRCRISTMGFGRGSYLDSELLSGIANQFSGNFGFISDTSMLSTTWLYIIANLIHETEITQPKILYKNNSKKHELKINKLMNNQTKTFLLPGNKNKDIQLEYYGSDGKCYQLTPEEKPIENDWMIEKTRHLLCQTLEEIMNYMDIDQLLEAGKRLDDLRQQLEHLNSNQSPIIQGYLDDIVSSGKAHDGGQLSMAISRKDYYQGWGCHYLRALHNGHLTKCKGNFKDKGLNYDTVEIQQAIKNMEMVFMDMPPPQASKKTEQTVSMTSSQTLYNQGGGCFQADCLVTTASGTTYPVNEIKKGDLLQTPNGSARVLCVTHIMQSPNGCLLCNLGNNTLITPYHPIKYQEKWCFPKDHFPQNTYQVDRVYNFVLDKDHQIYINNILTPTFGHNLQGEVIGHPFFGSDKIINDLSKLHGFNTGLVTIYPSYFKRNPITNLVEKIESNTDISKDADHALYLYETLFGQVKPEQRVVARKTFETLCEGVRGEMRDIWEMLTISSDNLIRSHL